MLTSITKAHYFLSLMVIAATVGVGAFGFGLLESERQEERVARAVELRSQILGLGVPESMLNEYIAVKSAHKPSWIWFWHFVVSALSTGMILVDLAPLTKGALIAYILVFGPAYLAGSYWYCNGFIDVFRWLYCRYYDDIFLGHDELKGKNKVRGVLCCWLHLIVLWTLCLRFRCDLSWLEAVWRTMLLATSLDQLSPVHDLLGVVLSTHVTCCFVGCFFTLVEIAVQFISDKHKRVASKISKGLGRMSERFSLPDHPKKSMMKVRSPIAKVAQNTLHPNFHFEVDY